MLSGNEFVKLADKVIEKHPEAFEAMMEFERTKKLPKLKYKERVNFTIDSDLFKKFRRYCEEKGMKMSNEVEKLIKEDIE